MPVYQARQNRAAREAMFPESARDGRGRTDCLYAASFDDHCQATAGARPATVPDIFWEDGVSIGLLVFHIELSSGDAQRQRIGLQPSSVFQKSNAFSERVLRELDDVVEPGLGHQVSTMAFNGLHADGQAMACLFCGQPLGQEL